MHTTQWVLFELWRGSSLDVLWQICFAKENKLKLCPVFLFQLLEAQGFLERTYTLQLSFLWFRKSTKLQLISIQSPQENRARGNGARLWLSDDKRIQILYLKARWRNYHLNLNKFIKHKTDLRICYDNLYETLCGITLNQHSKDTWTNTKRAILRAR